MENTNTLEKDFEEVLLNTIGGMTSMYLSESVFQDEKLLGTMNINEKVTEKSKTYFKFTQEYVYMHMEFQYEKDPELKSFLHMFKQFLDKSTKAISSLQEKYYTLTCSLVKVENGTAYVIELYNPVWCFIEDSTLICIFDMKNMKYGTMGMDMDEIDKQIDFEINSRVEVLAKENDYLNTDSDIDVLGASDD